eukprot:TRINITY_DN1099_c0_g1_i4.p1 TRINITY_DN1099_c0_g1~~TRINITY_DN1099_c0_g1_i4.p1  ORF type:complete len:111 (+),score=16.79 TRINITY_DN1099_c0_g1_i4:2-334(+)
MCIRDSFWPVNFVRFFLLSTIPKGVVSLILLFFLLVTRLELFDEVGLFAFELVVVDFVAKLLQKRNQTIAIAFQNAYNVGRLLGIGHKHFEHVKSFVLNRFRFISKKIHH